MNMKKFGSILLLGLLIDGARSCDNLAHRHFCSDTHTRSLSGLHQDLITGGMQSLSCGYSDGERSKPFDTVDYWHDFYREETGTWDWYSTADWLPELVSSLLPWPLPPAHSSAGGYRLLDLGCGISSLLLDVAQAGPPGKFRRLVGIDFCPSAIALMCAHTAALPAEIDLRPEFFTADAADLRALPAGSFDALVDKGCLDCHVATPHGRARIPALLREARRVLAPGGFILVLAVCDADVPHLLATARVRPPRPAAPGGLEDTDASSCAAATAIDGTGLSDIACGGGGSGEEASPLFHVHEVLAYQHKHLFVARTEAPPAPPRLRCLGCDGSGSYPPPLERCRCGETLGRFALS